MKIGIVGAGVAGLSAAFALSKKYDVTVFEQDDRVGGHSNTVSVPINGQEFAVDTGFIIYNRKTYPNLTRLFRELGVRSVPTHMNFSVSIDEGAFEWATPTPGAIFAQPTNLFDLRFHGMLIDVLRFFRVARNDLRRNQIGDRTLGEYLKFRKFGKRFRDDFLIPMGSAIWSTSPMRMLEFPAHPFLHFYENHGLLSVKQPTWLTVKGGSSEYVKKLSASFSKNIRINSKVTEIRRHSSSVLLRTTSGEELNFDRVVVATHSDQALEIIKDSSQLEQNVLGNIQYTLNRTFLHGDVRLMPKRRAAWASWNYAGTRSRSGESAIEQIVSVTYWMNRLQHIDRQVPFFVSLNPTIEPRSDLVYAKFDYHHPRFNADTVAAQMGLQSIQGANRTWYCGAYTGYGFHEDGLRAGLEVAESMGASVGWQLQGEPRIFRNPAADKTLIANQASSSEAAVSV